MHQTTKFTKLTEAIACFKTKLEAPVDCGDRNNVQAWAEDVIQSFEKVDEIIQQRRDRIREKFLNELAENDPSLADQVRQLDQTDSDVEEMVELIKSHLIVLCMKATTDIEPRLENAVSDDHDVLEVKTHGGELIEWIGEQESSVSTWYTQSFPNAE